VFAFQLLTAVYCLGAIRKVAKPLLFLSFVLVAFAAACGVILTDNLLFLLVAWEVFLVALYAVIHSSGEHAEGVAMKALVIGGASDFLMILGLMLFLKLTGGATIAAHLPVASSTASFIAFLLLFLGAGAKAGMFPFHTWIPDAAEVMPAAGFAALPASLEKVLGIYFLFTVSYEMFALNEAARIVMYAFGVVTVFVSIVPALVEENLRKVLALTAISPVGFMVVGLATSEVAGLAGALLYMLTHATYKSGMFFAVGHFEEHTGSARLAGLQGIARLLPLTGLGFLLAFTAAVSLPPTGGFIAKDLIFEGVVARGHHLVFVALWIGAVLNMAVFCKVIAVLWGRGEDRPLPASAVLAAPVLVLGLGAVLTGWIFTLAAPVFGAVLPVDGPGWIAAVWHLSPLTVASYSIYLFGALLFFAARARVAEPADTFASLRQSPVLGRTLELAAQKKFDGYEVGVRVVNWIADLVFRRFERLIDEVVDWIIRTGRSFSGALLSAPHDGVYRTYLGWVIVGLAIVAALVLM
jgi:NADH-quinone oxidoreductase subunit L